MRMIEIEADIWEFVDENSIEALLITTNGMTTYDGRAVMGRGIAYEAKLLYPGIDKMVGNHILKHGNIPGVVGLTERGSLIMTLPTKHHWSGISDIELIVDSCYIMTDICYALRLKSVAMPRPGCGNGKLDWVDVRMRIQKILESTGVTYYVLHNA